MQITAVCPKCEARYQFDSALIGKKVRCGNAECREVFEVRQASADAGRQGRPAARDRRAPTFDADSGEHQTVANPDAPREADWSKLPPPPVRKRDDAPAAEVVAVERKPDSGRASADEVMALMGLAPTAQTNGAEDYVAPANTDVVELEMPAEDVIVDTDDETDYAKLYHQYGRPARRKWVWWILLGMFLVLAGGGVGLFMYSRIQIGKIQQKAIDDANSTLDRSDYSSAAKAYDELIAKYSTHADAGRWRFLRDYSKALDSANNTATPPETRRTELETYLASVRDGNDSNRDLVNEKGRIAQLRQAFVRVGEDQLKAVSAKADAKDFAGARKGLDDYNKTKEPITKYTPADVKPTIPADQTELLAKITSKIEIEQKYTDFVRSSETRLKAGNPADITLVEKEAKEKGFDNRQEVVEMLKAAKVRIQEQIVFKPAGEKPNLPVPAESLSSLILGPNIDKIPENPSVIFAVARGVLYALVEAKGQILWTTRVGIDDSSLPVRVPKAGSSPALAVVPSSDGKGLIAREVLTGKARWFQELPASIRGQPLLVEGHLIVPLTDDKGTIFVIDSRDGHQLGSLEINQRIGAGAALQQDTARVFIAAESQNVFVFDAHDDFKLISIIATNHGPGSLRGEPVVVGGANQAYMILAQNNGFAKMQLRSFEILADGTSQPGVDHTLPGWSWFAPVCDQEKVAVVTDAGVFAIFGINQAGNQDPSTFPLMIDSSEEKPKAGRGVIVHAEERDFWFIANGKLQYKRMGVERKTGINLASGWKDSIKVGTPLHAGQVSADRSTIYVVTQESSPAAWLATAVNAKTGEIVWQRPLGIAAQGDPVRYGDFLVQVDRGAGVYEVDTKAPIPAGKAWELAGQAVAAPRLDIFGEPYLLPHSSGKLGVLVYSTEDGHKLNAVWITPGQKASTPESVAIAAPLAGAPILMDKTLVMPLADGGLHRWTIGDKDVKRGPDWRGTGLGENARAFLIAFGKDGLLVSDGNRGLTQYQWAVGADYQSKQPINVPNRIAATPLIVPSKDGQPRVAVADATGRLYLYEGDPIADSPSVSWERLGNEITAGPFLVSSKGEPHLIVVVDHTNVVCLSPTESRKVWSYSVKEKGVNGDGVSTRPLQIGEALVLADVSGRYLALDVETGNRLTDQPFPGLNPLPAAPATMPIEFGPDRLFAPLTDGTVLLIPTESLLPKK